MSPFFIYLIQVNIALALFYLLYAVLLKSDTFLRLRRFYFLSVIVFSLLYPFCAIPALGDIWTSHSSGFREVGANVFIDNTNMKILVGEDVVAPTTISWKGILSWAYVAITILFVLRFLFQLFSIYRIRAKSEQLLFSGIPVYQLKENMTPFSFFSLIFIHTDNHSEDEFSQILLHEHTHARQWHSFDIMLIESVCLFSWWNPFVWLMKREMTMNLEYLADSGVLREGVDSREYQYHLLRLTYHETAVQIVNNFNVSQLKQRIMMMNKTKTPTLKLAKYLLIVPLLFLFVTANSIYAGEKNGRETITGKNVNNQIASGQLEESIQPPVIEDTDLPEPPPEKKKSLEIKVENVEKAQFPGGENAYNKYLAENIRYPVIAQENGIQGHVSVLFNVDRNGKVTVAKFEKSVDPSLDTEVKRVIENMPDWVPAKIVDGETTNMTATADFVFQLEGSKSQSNIGSVPENAVIIVGYAKE